MAKKRAPTMSDVARLAGVNRVTASVALNSSPNSPKGGTRVSKATRQRVLDAARQLGYTPNTMAQALRGARTNVIGFYTGYEKIDFMEPFPSSILNGLRDGCHRHQQDLVLFGSFKRDSADAIYASLASGKLDGLVILPPEDPSVANLLVDSHLPVVAIATSVDGMPTVRVDDENGSRLIVEHLAQKGHDRIIYRRDKMRHGAAERRYIAFIEHASSYGMTVTTTEPEGFGGALSAQERELLMIKSPDERPTAFVAWADSHARYILYQCSGMGLRVPDEIAIIGFDGIITPVNPCHDLTTVHAPWQAVAERAVDLLVQLIIGDEPQPNLETVFPVDLIVGETT